MCIQSEFFLSGLVFALLCSSLLPPWTEVSVWVFLDCTGGFCPQIGLGANAPNASHARSADTFLSLVHPLSLPFRWLPSPPLCPSLSHHPTSKPLSLVAVPEKVLSLVFSQVSLSFCSFSSIMLAFVWNLAFLDYEPWTSIILPEISLTSSHRSLYSILNFPLL